MDTFVLPVRSLQPSQFHLSVSKLTAVLAKFDPGALGPLPVRSVLGTYALTDGHHTAFVALLMGIQEVAVWYDTDDMDWGAYERSVAECRRRGVTGLSDLIGRLVSDCEYDALWGGWCDRMHSALEAERRSRGRIADP